MVAIKIIAFAVFLICFIGFLVNWIRYAPSRLYGHNERTLRARNIGLVFWAIGMADILVASWLFPHG